TARGARRGKGSISVGGPFFKKKGEEDPPFLSRPFGPANNRRPAPPRRPHAQTLPAIPRPPVPAREPPAPRATFFSSRRRHPRFSRDWSSDVCSSDLSAKRGCKGSFVQPRLAEMKLKVPRDVA